MIHLGLNDSQNPQFSCAVLCISFMEVVSCILPSWSCQFIKLYLLLPKSLQALLHLFGDCAHHPAGLVIIVPLALLCVFTILIFPILPIVGNCNIAQIVSNSNHHRRKCFFGIFGRQSHIFSCLSIFLLIPNHCLCVLNSLCRPSGFSLNIILNPFLFLFVASEECFSWSLSHKLLIGSHTAQCPKGSDSFCFETALAFICLMTLLGQPLYWCALFARRNWRKDLFWSIDHCSLRWLCCWAKCWMLQVMEASCIFYVKVGTFTHLEQSKIFVMTVNKMGIVKLTVQHDLIVSISFM